MNKMEESTIASSTRGLNMQVTQVANGYTVNFYGNYGPGRTFIASSIEQVCDIIKAQNSKL